jgi:hypothetical protein
MTTFDVGAVKLEPFIRGCVWRLHGRNVGHGIKMFTRLTSVAPKERGSIECCVLGEIVT